MADSRKHADDLRGAATLVVQATKAVTSVVEDMHTTIGGGPRLLGRPLRGPVRFVNGLVYGAIRGVSDVVGLGLDVALKSFAPFLGEGVPGPEREALQAVLNGVVGDHLEATGNALALPMRFRCRGATLDPSAPGSEPSRRKLLVLVHGSCVSDAQWNQNGHDHGQELAESGGYELLYVSYNSGRHVSVNGAEFAQKLEQLLANWSSVEEVVIVAHSMGGLVSRSACHAAAKHDQGWLDKLRAMAFLGTPHHGAPLEKGGNWVEFLLGANRYSAPLAELAKLRSAGVTDLRYGAVIDAHWEGRERFALDPTDTRTPVPLPPGVRCYAVAGRFGPDAPEAISGDGLVSTRSARGEHPRPELCLDFTERVTMEGINHLTLLSDPRVYERLERWLVGEPAGTERGAG